MKMSDAKKKWQMIRTFVHRVGYISMCLVMVKSIGNSYALQINDSQRWTVGKKKVYFKEKWRKNRGRKETISRADIPPSHHSTHYTLDTLAQVVSYNKHLFILFFFWMWLFSIVLMCLPVPFVFFLFCQFRIISTYMAKSVWISFRMY